MADFLPLPDRRYSVIYADPPWAYRQAKTYFDQITASPAVLAEFLASIPALETPWDEAFQRTYCAACSAENCDAENCPHQAERNSPAWFLAQEVTGP